jgi:hypothetical protein
MNMKSSNDGNDTELKELRLLELAELRRRWAEAWGIQPHARIGRLMLERSLAYKLRERRGEGLTPEQQKRLDFLVSSYKRRPAAFEAGPLSLKPGTRLVRNFRGKQHSVLVKTDGFEYEGNFYTSLSQVASDIAGTRWNGKTFFGLKKGKRQ